MTEAELVEAHLAGDRAATESLVDAFEGPMLRFAQSFLGDGALAQDAVQEALMRFLREGARLREVKSLLPWLLQVTRNLCVDLARKERQMSRKHEASAAGVALAADPADAPALEGELRERVNDALAKLPPLQRDVLRLKIWEGLTYREIAARLDMTLTNVSYHFGQAVKALGLRLRPATASEEAAS